MRLTDIKHLHEGGNALAEYGVQRIKKDDIESTIAHVASVTGIPKEDLIPLGTVGKTTTSGDIDLAVDMNRFNPEHIDKVLQSQQIGGEYKKSNRVGSYAIPIKGDPNNGYVQVDLMFTTNPKWAEFSYYSAGEGSRFKGAVRTSLLAAVASVLNEPGKDHVQYLPHGELAVRVGRTLDLPSGLKRVYQYRPKKVAGDGYVKSMKSVEADDFKRMYPDVQLKGGSMLIDDPEKVVKALFGRGVSTKDVESAEQIMHLIAKKFNHADQTRIFRIAAKRLSGQKGKIRMPEELEPYL